MRVSQRPFNSQCLAVRLTLVCSWISSRKDVEVVKSVSTGTLTQTDMMGEDDGSPEAMKRGYRRAVSR